MEDVALAGVMRQHGFRVLLARGEDVLSVRMYDSLPSLWEGFSKNSFRFLLASPPTGILTALASIAIGSAVPSALRAGTRAEAMANIVVPAVGLLPWYRRFGVPLMYAGLFPVASALFGLIALDSIRRWATPGATRWRGRQY